MEDEKKIEEVVTSENNEETITPEVDSVSSDDNSPTLEDFYESEKKRKELFERAKKAEEELKRIKKSQSLQSADVKTNNEYLTREEAVLLTKGYDEDDLAQLNILAKATGQKLNEVITNPLFTAYKEQKKAKESSEKAQLKSSGGSAIRSDKPVADMSEDEHKAFWAKANAK